LGFVVAIDGPAASGKGTIATRLAHYLGLPVLDTGLLYRAVAAAALTARIDLDDGAAVSKIAAALDLDCLERPDLRTAAMGEAASRVAAHPGVREALNLTQRAFAAREPGAVLDGRDIGTVIVPGAPVKLFITAAPEARAKRRWRQLLDLGETVEYVDILGDIVSRDARDSARRIAPLRRAEDAVLLDTTDMSIDAAFDAARRIVEAARARMYPD
jgi:CMP/dCMP kinase